MKNVTILALMIGTIISAGSASAQGIYLDLGGDGPRRYRDYDGPRYRFRTPNGCQNGWTVQDGLCKPYRGY